MTWVPFDRTNKAHRFYEPPHAQGTWGFPVGARLRIKEGAAIVEVLVGDINTMGGQCACCERPLDDVLEIELPSAIENSACT